MKILIHGFGTFSIIFRHLVELAKERAPQVEWSILLPTPHHYSIVNAVIPADRILNLEEELTRNPQPVDTRELLAAYNGNIFADIEAEKRAFKHWPAWRQLARAAEIYQIYEGFLRRMNPSHLLIAQIEGYEGKMLSGLARKLGIKVMVPASCRSIGGSYFGSDAYETLPVHRKATAGTTAAARAFIAAYRERSTSAYGMPENPDEGGTILTNFPRPLAARTARFITRAIARPDLFDIEHLRTSFLNNVTPFRNTLWWVNRKRNESQFDVDNPNQLPVHFIYYPLQYSPESSINTPAPFYVDQLRAVDAIRFAMPSNCILVVKEHPACLLVRPPSFIREIRRKAGVVVARHDMSSRTLIERASVTISITGTATLEAFLLGKPAIVLGSSLISSYLGGACTIDQLPGRIRSALTSSIMDEEIEKAIAEILSVRYDFAFRAPGFPGEPVLRKVNIERFLNAILDHIARGAETTAADRR